MDMGLKPANPSPDASFKRWRSGPPPTVVALIFAVIATLLMMCGTFLLTSHDFLGWLMDEAGDVLLFQSLALTQLLAMTVTFLFLRGKLSFRSAVGRLSVLLTANVLSLLCAFAYARSKDERLLESTSNALRAGAVAGIVFAIVTLILLLRFPPVSGRLQRILCHIVGLPVAWAVLFFGIARLPKIDWRGMPVCAIEWVCVLSTAYVVLATDRD
jgi:hypothetical protein